MSEKPYNWGRDPKGVGRRWIRHGPTVHGKIGWELEGSGWINWGWSPHPPDHPGPLYINPRQPKSTYAYALENIRRAKGQDPATGDFPDLVAPEEAVSDEELDPSPPVRGALLRRGGGIPRMLPRESRAEFQAKRRRRLLQHIREVRPRIHAAAAYRWVDDYMKRHSRK